MQCGAVAHLGERFNGIEEVRGSSPRSSTIDLALGVKLAFLFFLFHLSGTCFGDQCCQLAHRI